MCSDSRGTLYKTQKVGHTRLMETTYSKLTYTSEQTA